MKYLVKRGAKTEQVEVSTPLEGRICHLRLALKVKTMVGQDDVFLRQGQAITKEDEAEHDVAWLAGPGDPPTISIGDAKASKKDPTTKTGPSVEVKIKLGSAAVMTVGIPADVGSHASDLRAALLEAEAIEDGSNFLTASGAELARRDEAGTLWRDLTVKGVIGLTAVDKQTIGTKKPGGDGLKDATNVSLGPDGKTVSGNSNFTLGPTETRTNLAFTLTPDQLGQIVEMPANTLGSLSPTDRMRWLREHNVFKSRIVRNDRVTLAARDVFQVVPAEVEPEYSVPDEKTVYRNTKAASSIEHDIAKLCDNSGGGTVGGQYGGFSGQISMSGGRKSEDRTVAGESTLYVSSSVLVTALRIALPFENLVLTPWASALVSGCVGRLGCRPETAAADMAKVAELFDQIGSFFALSSLFGGRLTIDEKITRKTYEHVQQEAMNIETKAKAKYTSYFSVAAKGHFKHSDESFESSIKTSEDMSYVIRQEGGALGSLSDPARWCASLGDVDNLARILDFDLVPVMALFPTPQRNAVTSVINLAQASAAFRSSPVNLLAMISWFENREDDGLD